MVPGGTGAVAGAAWSRGVSAGGVCGVGVWAGGVWVDGVWPDGAGAGALGVVVPGVCCGVGAGVGCGVCDVAMPAMQLSSSSDELLRRR